MCKVIINGKTCKINKKHVSIWELFCYERGSFENDETNPINYRCVYLASDGVIDMLPQYTLLEVYDGMIVSIIKVNEFGQVIVPAYKCKVS